MYTEKVYRQSWHPVSVSLHVCTCSHLCVVSTCARVFLELTFVDIECDGADCDADHAFGVVEKLNGLGVQGKVISVLCVEDREGAPMNKDTALHRRTQATNDQRERVTAK